MRGWKLGGARREKEQNYGENYEVYSVSFFSRFLPPVLFFLSSPFNMYHRKCYEVYGVSFYLEIT